MNTLSPSLELFLKLTKVQSIMQRRFDSGLRGLGLSDFVILHHLSQSRDERMRRTDLAERMGLTASGITRLLAPMEKIGLIGREKDDRDARVSYVVLRKSGLRMLTETMEDAEMIAERSLPFSNKKSIGEFSQMLSDMGGSIA